MTTKSFAFRAAMVGAVACAYLIGAYLLRSGRMMDEAMLAVLVGAPLGLFVWLKRPIVLSYGVYALLVPWDNLLTIGSFGTLTKLLGMVAGVLLVLAVLNRQRFVTPTAALPLLLGLFLWMAISATWALDQGVAIKSLTQYGALFALYAILATLRPEKGELESIMFCTAVGGLAAAAYGANMFFHDPSLAANPEQQRLILTTATASIDPNQFSDALLFPAALTTMWALCTRNLAFKIAGFAALLLFAVAILASGSREALLALSIILLYYLVRSRHRIQLAVPAVFGVIMLSSMQTSTWERFGTLFSTGGSGRLAIWLVGAEAAKHRLLEGYGIGNFPQAYNLFYLGVHQVYPYGFDSPAHNIVLHYLVELGIVGLLLIGAFFWLNFRALRVIPKDSRWYDYRIALEASLVATITVSLTIDLFTYKYAWLLFSLVAILVNVARTPQPRVESLATSPIITPARSARS